MDLIAKLPEMCENEYIRTTALEVEKREAEKAKAAAAKQAQKPVEEKKPEPEKPAEAPVEKAAVAAGAVPAEEPFRAMPQSEKTAENDLPFFNSDQEKKPRRTDLQFGRNLNK